MEKNYFVWIYFLVNVISATRRYYCDGGLQATNLLPSLSFTEEPGLLRSLKVCTESEYRTRTIFDYKSISLEAGSRTAPSLFHMCCRLSKFERSIAFSSKYCVIDMRFTRKAMQDELCRRCKHTSGQVLLDRNGDIIAPTKVIEFYSQQGNQLPQKNTKHERNRTWVNTTGKCLKRKYCERIDRLSELSLRKQDMSAHIFGPTINLIYRFTIRIVSGAKYTPELKEPSAWQFKTLAKRIQDMVDRTLEKSPLALLYLSTQITSFRRGSVVSTFTVRLSASSGVSGSTVQSVITNAMNGSSNNTGSLVLDPTTASLDTGIIPTNTSSLITRTETDIYNGSIQATFMIASPTATASVHVIATSKLFTVARATTGVTLTPTVAPVPIPTPFNERDVEVSLQLLSETFHSDLENKSSLKYQNLSAKVNKTLTDLYSRQIRGFKEVTINSFSNGSVIVNHSVAISSSSNVTTQQLEKTLKDANGTGNLGNFVFGQITTKEKCTPSFCMNSGTCQSNSQGAYCSCSSNYKGSRCDTLKDPVHGNYSNWSDFGECSQSCSGGRQYRRRDCTSPAPQYGGKNCSILGPEMEFRDCNKDVRCPEDWWIALAVCLGILVLICILLLVLVIRRRRMRLQRAEEDGPYNKRYIPPSHSKANGTRNTMVPLETMAIRNRTNSPRGSPEGHRNPEFINDNQDDEDDDIYKAQLLLFLKQHHLVAPGYGQDNASVTSEQSRRQSRRPSSYSEQNNREGVDYGDHQGSYENEDLDVDSIQVDDSDIRRVSGASYTSRDGKR